MLSSWEKLGEALSSGSLDEALIHVRLITMRAIALSAAALIADNDQNGDPIPSP